jgi:hypothetical protein
MTGWAGSELPVQVCGFDLVDPVIPSACYDGCVRRLKPPEPSMSLCYPLFFISCFPHFLLSCFSTHPTMLRHVATGADPKRDRVVLPASDVRPFTGAQRSLKVPPPPEMYPRSIGRGKHFRGAASLRGRSANEQTNALPGGQPVVPVPRIHGYACRFRPAPSLGLSADATVGRSHAAT